MIPYEFGDVLLLKSFPFSNLVETKKRPALVLADVGDDDILVARVTGESVRNEFDFVLDSWKAAGLLLPSTIRLTKMATLQKRLVVKRLGHVGSPERRKLRALLKKLFDLS